MKSVRNLIGSKSKHKLSIFYALLAAALYSVSIPFSKILLESVSPMMMAAFLYIGAGLGMTIVGLFRKNILKSNSEPKLTKNELPYVIAMILLDVAAPIFLMFGLTLSGAATASLLNNFEIVATAVIALVIFKEEISNRLWFAIILITLSSALLTVDDFSAISISWGSIFILVACICWGLENNFTRKLSVKDPQQIVIIKGLFSGFSTLAIAYLFGESFPDLNIISIILLLGFFAFGLSIFFYVSAQREIGAAKTSAFYAVAPFFGVFLSFIIFKEKIEISFIAALIIMIAGAFLASENSKNKQN